MANFVFRALRISPKDEFRKSILPAIRDLVVLLKDSDSDVRAAGTEALSTLSKDCKLES